MAAQTRRRALLIGAALITAASALAALTLMIVQWPLTSATDGDIDDVFVARMLEMDTETSEIARLADTHAEHEELRQLATEILRSIRRDGALMGSGRVRLPFASLQRASVNGSEIQAVLGAPVFDKAFIEVMMSRYERGIEWCRRAIKSARNGRIRMLASDLVASRARELVLMRLYYEAWYGIPPAR
jgi:uncharacterized protein (DUF305 family)